MKSIIEVHLKETLSHAKNPLILAVGGGNDSVSTLLLQKQLQKSFHYFPDNISIVAVLPDCLNYQNLVPTSHPLVGIITENTTRSVQNHLIDAFPERILSSNKKIISSLPIKEVYGISMKEGSIGVKNALIHLINQDCYDLILAIDVGGDFIAEPDNLEVLSPMMDGYMLYALKELENYQQTKAISDYIPVIYSIFGLGTDGESSPQMLRSALNTINEYYEGQYNPDDILDVIKFYRTTVEKNRYSRTADFTIQEIEGKEHDNPAQFRGRFHVKQSNNEKSTVHYGLFNHEQDPYFFGKYYLFNDISQVNNIFSTPCHNGIEWFINVQKEATKINHELNGQSYMDLEAVLNDSSFHNISILFGTPSRKFNKKTQSLIAQEINNSIVNNVYDLAFLYKEQKNEIVDLSYIDFNEDLILISKNPEILEQFFQFFTK